MSIPIYSEEGGALDLVALVGKTLGPITFTPTVPESIAGRSYAAQIYDTATGQSVATGSVTVVNSETGIISVTFSVANTTALSAGKFYGWECTYTITGVTKRAYYGKLEARY